MKAVVWAIVVSVILPGCDGPNEGLSPPAPTTLVLRKPVEKNAGIDSLDEMVGRKWEAAKKDFSVPVRTPYDGDVDLRWLYLEGFREGLTEGLECKGHPGGCFFPNSPQERAWAEGYRAGGAGPASLRLKILGEIQEELLAKLGTTTQSRLPDLRQHLLTGDAYAAAGSVAFMAYVKEIEGADQTLAEGLLRGSSERREKILAAMWGYGAPALSARRTREALKTVSTSDADERIRARAAELAARFDRR